MPGIVLGPGKTAVNKTSQVSALLGFIAEWPMGQLNNGFDF